MPRLSRTAFLWAVLLAIACCLPMAAYADKPVNRLANPGFEDGFYKGESVGTSLSSWIANGWTPWSLFFTLWATHTSGFYQRVQVAPGSKVTFSIWAQIYTGQRELRSGGNYISDLDKPTKPSQEGKRGPGEYKVYVGIDPYGDTPAAFGAPPSANTIWSDPVIDFQTREIDAAGTQIDAWRKLSVSAIAQSDHITVFTKGQPKNPVKHNDSFWDDAILTVQSPPTPVPSPTPPLPTVAPTQTDTPLPTETLLPSETPQPTGTATPVPPTATSIPPTATSVPPTAYPDTVSTSVPATATPMSYPEGTPSPPPTSRPTLSPTPPSPEGLFSRNAALILIYGGIMLCVIAVAVWLHLGRTS